MVTKKSLSSNTLNKYVQGKFIVLLDISIFKLGIDIVFIRVKDTPLYQRLICYNYYPIILASAAASAAAF